MVRCRCHHPSSDRRGAGENDLVHERRGAQRDPGFGEARDGCHQIGVVAVDDQCLLQYATKVSGTPGCVFGNLPNHGVSGHQTGNDVIDRIVKGVVPRSNGNDDSQRHIFHPGTLVNHHGARWTGIGTQPEFTPFANGSNLFAGGQDFSHDRIDLWFPGFASRDATNVFDVVDNVLLDRSQHHSALGKGSLFPLGLCRPGFFEYFVDFLGGHVLGVADELFRGGVVAVEQRLVAIVQQRHFRDRISLDSVILGFFGCHGNHNGRNRGCKVLDPQLGVVQNRIFLDQEVRCKHYHRGHKDSVR
mmetsp:Transcript_34425/g.81149  ORF Transcript_34425/g.81149 Transcript_34425/m.81149 type:complete len:302 (-) Transcript_34425:73-978(-)